MRQILYVSLSTAAAEATDVAGILQQSRHNNAIDGVTGLLWYDGGRFLQVFEGSNDSVTSTWARIAQDRRHKKLTVIHDRHIILREFGHWTMAQRYSSSAVDAYDDHIRGLLAEASPEVGQAFIDMIAVGNT